ncbi:CDP-alcohol phosphatidyltransferase [Lecanosticta acicola]|uniref:CDP-alcohol phosphatidyltransferase n=1 Tax=Lecanosticta acicola TaxID=111012 RepID=A0AAI8YWU3_9PEZI|nr:CDP-alcohol phosphatidyltransferase [Lecanosticta acicola]
MFDIALRPVKDRVFDPLCAAIPPAVAPLHLTIAAFICGVASCVSAAFGSSFWALALWVLNRALDCLDGAVARQRDQSSDLGGFLDLLGDFVVYSGIPISCALGLPNGGKLLWISVAVVEATFHVNNFVLFYVAAVAEKRKAAQTKEKQKQQRTEELTSVMMRPALIEGAESGVVFTLMLAWPSATQVLCWALAVGVAIGTIQRVTWVVQALS